MKVEFLGAQGGVSNGYSATSFLIDGNLLIDAGSAASNLPVERQAEIDNILLTHSHLDHIKDLAFLCDNCFDLRDECFNLHAHATTITNLKNHLFNDAIWPDFSTIPSPEAPTIRYHSIIPEEEFTLGGYKILPVQVNHPGDSMGYFIEKDDKCILFTGDTSSTQRIWEIAGTKKNIKAIVTEVSFPNSLKEVAKLSYHMTAETFKEEHKKMPKNIPIYITHLKPAYQEKVISEIDALNLKNIHIVHHDGKIINL
ncbi:MAG: 3',5'-cyclic-nucleotide phosphodiesterase [Halobacteriovoraceae bacterium]|nr:3',5'-cyclic-nucleotide phosphodiesterase [Halobacteriovoraceae bacterium]